MAAHGATTAATTAHPKPRDLNLSSTLTQGIPKTRPIRSPGASAVVAVSATADAIDSRLHRVRLNSAYVAALESAGLIPLVVPPCLLYTSDAADERSSVDLGGR